MPRSTPRSQVSRARLLALTVAATLPLACSGGDAPPADANKSAAATPDAAKPAKKKPSRPAPSAAQVLDAAKKYFSPLPARAESAANPTTPEKIALGRQLYYDTRLSKGHDVSCNSCHLLDKFGVDNELTSKGHKGQRGERNSPTVYNAATHFAQFWDGRAATVEDQAQMPITNPVEMAMPDPGFVVRSIKSIPGYVDAFKAAFPGDADPVTMENLGRAIGSFERGLMTPGPFDEFLAGKMTALNGDALRGLELFIEFNCISCHTGPAIGGTMYQKLGSVKSYETKDEGRFKITKNPEDKFVFKVPSLRNITKTAPYLHDGSAATLDDVLNIMATYQLAKGSLDDDERKYLTAFLTSLEGTIDPAYIAKPDLPPSGPETPAPDPS
ncbi:cytochrome c peroxidase [Nannocystis sp.]|uniref:cytochrome-c peroxidase n=1 Tax=Nannocystis sp. TaxID=1962667 RepID=UPI0025E5D979|nr:cytochrome c peroxidase [Nannocystis sp.]MBK7824785.1 c-type cytochrome [Nannocystis sp.]